MVKPVRAGVRVKTQVRAGMRLPKSTTDGKELGANPSQILVLKYHLLAGGLSASYTIFQGC